MTWKSVALAALMTAGSANASIVVTAAHMLDPVKGVVLDNPVW